MKTKNNILAMNVFCLLIFTSLSTSAGEVHAIIKDNEGHEIEDAIVTATPLDPNNVPKQKNNKKEVVDQVDKEFTPFVMPLYVKTWVHFPNNDDIRHHVYSFSPAKKFELPLYAGTSASPVLFDQPGVVMLGCNIHDWMIGYIYVSNTPYFAKSERNRNTSISDLPAGDYVIRVWHHRMVETEESTSSRLTIGSSGATNVEWQLQLKPEFKIPRTSLGSSFGYH